MRKTVIILLWVVMGVVLLFGLGSFCVMVLLGISRGLGESDEAFGFPEYQFYMDPTPKWTTDGDSIVFGHGDGRIYVVAADGSRLRSISEGSGRYDIDISPSISPDGSTIAYVTLRHETGIFWRSRHFEIVTAALDGSDKRRLTENETHDTSPMWSQDGSRIAFISGSSSWGQDSLFVMSSNGLEVNQIVDLDSIGDDYIVELPPSWSPDGRHLAFVTREPGSSDYIAHRVEIDGTGLTRIEDVLSSSMAPEWSPDGGHIAFAKILGNERVRLYVSAVDSSMPIELPVGGLNVSWSPDGLDLATGSFIVKVDGSSVIDSRSPGGFASWSPDGSRIAINAQPATEGRLLYDLDELDDIERTIESTPSNAPGVVLYTMNKDGTDRRILVEQNEDGSLSPGNGRPLDGGRPPATIYFDGVGPSRAPFDIEQCSNGVVVSNPDENPMLVGDCKTLLRIRDSLGANPPLNWSTDISITDWEGIVLGNASVERVQLSGRFLTGVVSPEFGGLSSLRELNLRDNWLGGSIPAELGNLTRLQQLYLGRNGLGGEIPAELGNLTRLRSLDLSGNELEGSIPVELGNLAGLQELALSDNGLTSVPEELAMPSLRRIWLEGNPIEGCIPGEILEKMVRGDSSDNPFEPCEN